MDNLEIERRWLLKRVPALVKYHLYQYHYSIFQCYAADGSRNRFREVEDFVTNERKYYLTRKTKLKQGVFEEFEKQITYEEFLEGTYTCDKKITKERFVYKDEKTGLKYEVDTLTDIALIFLEIEFPYDNYEFAVTDMPIDFQHEIIMEVTAFSEFSNYSLASTFSHGRR